MLLLMSTISDVAQHTETFCHCSSCRFGMTYVAADASKQRPIMIHRAIFGSMERFFGILVENYAGAFPLWLAPVQARLLPVNEAVLPYVQEVR